MTKLSTAETDCQGLRLLRLTYGIEQANTYLLVSGRHALMIDACASDVVDELISRNLEPDYVILTHEHVDHLWGLNALRARFPRIKVIAQAECSKAIGDPKSNKAAQYRIYAVLRFGKDYENDEAKNRAYRCAPAEIVFEDVYEFAWRGFCIRLLHTPGHSPGSSIAVLDEKFIFSGDTMLNEDTFLAFDGGNADQFSAVTLPRISGLREDAQVFPGHGLPFIKKDWKIS